LKLVDDKKPAGDKTITLAVGAEQSLPLVLAAERGSVRMLLRSPVDKDKSGIGPYKLQDLLAVQGQP
jgi:pilus assembly protein CpaB